MQDFEHQIRDLFDGTGFLPDDVFHVGTRDQPLGDPKAGLSAELDALAAYVTSLDHVNPSPYRNPDGSLTADGVAGKALFEKLGCDFCHGGAEFTDSARGMLHDVGTITALSGMHAGGPLLGIDTPTLLGVWETPPYLHDGSAATLRDVLTTRNPSDLHGYVSALSPQQVDQLVAYLQQIDGEPPVRSLPFDPPGQGQGVGRRNHGRRGTARRRSAGGCALRDARRATSAAVPPRDLSGPGRARPGADAAPRSCSRRARAVALLALIAARRCSMTACRPDAGDGAAPAAASGAAPTDWSKLPAVTEPGPRARAARRRARTPTIGSAPAAAATASPRLCAAAAGAPRSATWPSCWSWWAWRTSARSR